MRKAKSRVVLTEALVLLPFLSVFKGERERGAVN